MTELWEKCIKILTKNYGISSNELWRKSGYGNKTKFYEKMRQWKRDSLIETKDVGKEKHVFLSSPDEKVDIFIKNFGSKLNNYEIRFKRHLANLKRNKPLISPKQPMKKVKTKNPLLKLDKDGVHSPFGKTVDDPTHIWKIRGVHRLSGKTEASYAYIWKIRVKPRRYLEILLDLLYKLYQESSVISYATPICNDPKLIKAYQKRSEELITNTVNEIEDMFRGETDFAYVVNRLRMVLYGFIYKASMEAKFTKR